MLGSIATGAYGRRTFLNEGQGQGMDREDFQEEEVFELELKDS